MIEASTQERAQKVRPPRRLSGEYDDAEIGELARIPGVGRARAEELCRAGYTSTARLKAATEDGLAQVPGIGLGGAKVIKESLQFVAIVPQRWTKEQAMEEEYACPLCGCVTSVFAERCHDCGAEFEEAEIDDTLRTELRQMGAKAELAFYEVRLMQDRWDSALWYARGRLVFEMGNVPEALASLDRALEIRPGDARVLLARASVLSGVKEVGRAAKHLRAAVSNLLRKPRPEVERPSTEAEREVAPAAPPAPGPEVSGPSPTEPTEPKEPEPPRESAEGPTQVTQSLEELERLVGPVRSEPSPPGEPLERVTAGPAPLVGPPGGVPQGTKGWTRRGLVNGQGLINGRGRVNGLMNRDGFVNGAELTQVRPVRSVPATRYGLVAAALAISVLVAFLTVPPPSPPGSRIVVDGDIAEWSGLPGFQDVVPAANPDIALRSYAVFAENGFISIRLGVAGMVFDDRLGVDAFYVFFDSDGDPSTGYDVHGLGAEAFLAVDGGNGSVAKAAVHEWPSAPTDRHNWSSFSQIRSAQAAASGSVLEAQFSTDEVVLAPGFRALFLGNDFEGHEAVASVAIGSMPAALLVTQSTAPAGGVVAATGDPLLRLTFESFGTPVTVSAITLAPTGAGVVGPALPPPPLSPGVPASVDVPITFAPADAGSLASASIVSVAADAPVTIRGPLATAYLQAAPGGYRVDGYFGEWNATAADGDVQPVDNADVDIARFGTGRGGSTTVVYADTVGDVLRGRAAPEMRQRPGPGGPPSAPGVPARRSGEDIFRAYIDPDSRDANGTPVLGISAEFLLEVRGVHGRITSMWSYEWVGIWQRTTRVVEAANDRRQIESSIDLAGIPLFDPAVVLEAIDWSNGGDTTDPAVSRAVGFDVRAPVAPGFGVLGNSTGVQILIAPTLAGGSPPNLDGSCADSQYNSGETSSQANMTIRAGRKSNFVWICVEAPFDTTNNTTDIGYVYFDRDNSGGSAPAGGDRRFSISPGGSINRSIGSGGGWAACTPSNSPTPIECHSGDGAAAGFGTNRSYEFKIHETDVWNTSNPSPGQQAGFAVRLSDANNGTVYKWGSTSVDVTSTNLDTWGQLHVPEFAGVASGAAAGAIIGFGIVNRRRFARGRRSVNLRVH